MKNALNEIIDETKSGFMKGRHISSNIRLVIDLVQYSILLNEDPRKAFDTVSHHFIFDSWKLWFRTIFHQKWKTMYCGSNSSVKLANGTSPRCEVNQGTRQVCPISAFLFLVIALQNCYPINANISRYSHSVCDKCSICNISVEDLFFYCPFSI